MKQPYLLPLLVICLGACLPKDPADSSSAGARGDTVPPAPGVYMGRRIATTMHYTGAPWLMRESRDREEDTALLLETLDVKPGMTICDMGCGNGYYTIPLAQKTGASGRVYAVDIQAKMLDLLRDRAAAAGVTNIVPTLGTVVDPGLPEASIDLMLLVDVYHEMSHPEQMLAAMRKALRPDGRIVLVEFRAEDPTVPIKPLHKMSKDQVLKELGPNGFRLVADFDGLPWQHMMTFAKDDGADGADITRGADGADTAADDAWIPLFNGKDLTGWTPKFAGEDIGVNYRNTFRARDGVLAVRYDEYASFDGKFGHLFYEHEYGNYVLELEYRFVGEQAPGGAGWAFRNNGVMIHGQSPQSMRIDQNFPVSIEVQLLGAAEGSNGSRATGNLCTPGTNVVYGGELDLRHCIDSDSATFRGDQWVKLRIEAEGSAHIRHFINGKEVMHYTQPQLDERDSDARVLIGKRNGAKQLTGGTISLQAESHGTEFRNIRLRKRPH